MYPYVTDWIRLVRCKDGAAVVGNSVDKMMRLEVNESGFLILSLCNGTRSSEDIITQLSQKYMLEEDDKRSVQSFLEQYITMGVLVSQQKPEIKEPKVVGNEDIMLPINVGLEITSQCQLNCIHCFNSSGKQMEEELSIDNLIEIADEFVELGAVSFFITGGEPMLKQDIKRLIDHLCSKNLSVSLVSNGVYLPDDVFESLVRNKQISIRISIDGMHETHDKIRGVPGTFDRAERNIKRLIDAGKNVSISFTLNDINKTELEKVVRHFKQLGCGGIAVGVTSNAGRAKDNEVPHGANRDYFSLMNSVREKYDSSDFAVGLDICEEKIKQVLDEIPYANKCGAGYSSIALRPNGDITPCTTMPNWVIGKTGRLYETLNADKLELWRNRPTPTPELCGDCDETMFCAYCLASMLESNVPCKLKKVG